MIESIINPTTIGMISNPSVSLLSLAQYGSILHQLGNKWASASSL
jgi:hypothetical protein